MSDVELILRSGDSSYIFGLKETKTISYRKDSIDDDVRSCCSNEYIDDDVEFQDGEDLHYHKSDCFIEQMKKELKQNKKKSETEFDNKFGSINKITKSKKANVDDEGIYEQSKHIKNIDSYITNPPKYTRQLPSKSLKYPNSKCMLSEIVKSNKAHNQSIGVKKDTTKKPLACWSNSRIFINCDAELESHINNITNKFWSHKTWENYLEANGLTNYKQVNPDALIIQIGENPDNFYPKFIGNVEPDKILKEKTKINSMSNLVFMPRECDVDYYDLPIYVFCDGSVTDPQCALPKEDRGPDSKYRRFGWGCCILDNIKSHGESRVNTRPRITRWKSSENYLTIDIPSSCYAESLGALEVINMLKKFDPSCNQFNLQTKTAMPYVNGAHKSYTFNIHQNIKDATRPIIVVCDNVQILYLLGCALPSLGKAGSFLNTLSKEIKQEIALTNITGMWIKGHQKHCERNDIETLFKNCNEVVDILATTLTKSIDNLLAQY